MLNIIGLVAGVVGSSTLIGIIFKIILRPRLRLMYQPHIGADDSKVGITYAGHAEKEELVGEAVYVRAFLWNYGRMAAEDCTVAVDKIWRDDERLSLHMRSLVKWTHKDETSTRFAPRKLLPGQPNGVRVDVCKVDTVTNAFQILTEESHKDTGYHWYTEPGIYVIDLIAQSSTFWATPARCSLAVQFVRTETEIGLFVCGAVERRHLLKVI